ncbi:MAG: GNAT family N-acetyltransferase [Bacteroidetes bacterium]|nr:GNAT family N-acetyltransferase [Bacteroidota bacterium]
MNITTRIPGVARSWPSHRGSGRAFGFALYFANYPIFLTKFGIYLEDLFVEKEYRGRGIGGGLLKGLAGIAAS